MVRLVVVCLVIGMATIYATDASASTFKGRKVSGVIDEFRQQGIPFAYSTNLVSDELVVTVEPTSVDPLDIVVEILAPYRLAVRQEHGLYLVVRQAKQEAQAGTLLLIVREKSGGATHADLTIAAVPELPRGDTLTPGILQYSGVAPGKYRVVVDADGFERATSVVSVKPLQTMVLELPLSREPPEVETITVSSSRYEISRKLNDSSFFVDQRSIQQLPDLGDDPLRASHRLPGVAASVMSARPHFRGGENNETGIILDGYELLDPFHARDFNNFFSVIDPRVIDGVEVFTGGFPVQYGDRMSGLVKMDTIDPGRSRRAEVGVSVFNTSLLSAGSMAEGRGRWILSARRGNLDLIIENRYGVPNYYDVFGQLAFDFSSSTEISLNTLYARDNIKVILADNEDETEHAHSHTSNLQAWANISTEWSSELSSSSLIFINTFSNDRSGFVNDAERLTAVVSDVRDANRFGFRQDWNWTRSSRYFWSWGVELGLEQADYRYQYQVERLLQQADFSGIVRPSVMDLAASPSGSSYAAYLSEKVKIGERSFLELGLRWDDENYSKTASGPTLSPRVSLFHALASGPEFRLSWGRYFQAAQINELQIADGATEFWRAQRADQVIAGLRWTLAKNLSMRFELYQKDMQRLRSRYENLFDPLELLPEVELDRIQISPTSARARGVELMLDHSGDGPWSWWASYTYSQAYDQIDGRQEPRSWDQQHSLQAGLNFSSQKWDFAVAINAHSGWPTSDLEILQTPGDPPYMLQHGPRNAGRFAPYASVDTRLSRRYVIGDNLLTTFVELTNAFDRHNPCCVDFDVNIDENGAPHLERQEDSWLPLLPSLGFLLEF